MKTTQKHIDSVIEHAIDGIEAMIGYDSNIYGCDLHNELFNRDYFIIGTYQAKKWLEKNVGVFEAIEEIREYEQDNFGEVNTDFSSPENVLNMFTYIKGEQLLAESKTLQNKWNSHLDDEDLQAIKEELEAL